MRIMDILLKISKKTTFDMMGNRIVFQDKKRDFQNT